MADKVLLKGGFDKDLDKTFKLLEKLAIRFKFESARPTVWTAKQIEDLWDMRDCLGSLTDAVSELANRVRDD